MKQSFTKFAGLDGALVLVTGGATGIGSAIVENFVRQGGRVVFLDIDRQAAEGLITRLKPGSRVAPEFVYTDLKDVGSLKSTIESVQQRAGAVKILVNNAASALEIGWGWRGWRAIIRLLPATPVGPG